MFSFYEAGNLQAESMQNLTIKVFNHFSLLRYRATTVILRFAGLPYGIGWGPLNEFFI